MLAGSGGGRTNQPKLCRESKLRVWACLRGTPISQELTLDANLREQIDSPVDDDSGEMLTNINVFESPPRHGCPLSRSLSQICRWREKGEEINQRWAGLGQNCGEGGGGRDRWLFGQQSSREFERDKSGWLRVNFCKERRLILGQFCRKGWLHR